MTAVANDATGGRVSPFLRATTGVVSAPEPAVVHEHRDPVAAGHIAATRTQAAAARRVVNVRVRAANSGAGASTIAVALADALAAAGERVQLLDAAAPEWSGLTAATNSELGLADGWRRGMRDSGVTVDRVGMPVTSPGRVPAPRDLAKTTTRVLDVGWSERELRAVPVTWLRSWPVDVDVVVTRPGDTYLMQAELVTRELNPAELVVVVVGAKKWGGPEFAAAGPSLRRLCELADVVYAPVVPPRELPGITPGVLPRPLRATGQHLAHHITAICRPESVGRNSKKKEK